MEPGVLVGLAVAFISGQGFGKIVEILGDRWKGATARRRAEVDEATRLTREAEAKAAAAAVLAEDALRDRRITLELLSATRRVALDHGVPLAALPPVDLGGR